MTSSRPVRHPLVPAGSGRAYEDTLVGCFLSKSCLPSLPGKPYLFFDKPKTMSERDVDITASTMWQVRLNEHRRISRIIVLRFQAHAKLSGKSLSII